MLSKLTSKNQLTLPKSVISDFPGIEYFDVIKEKGRIVLTPVNIVQADTVRAKLAELGVTEADITEAIAWARQSKLRRCVWLLIRMFYCQLYCSPMVR